MKDNKCLMMCRTSQFLDPTTNTCLECHGTCLTCSGPYEDQCFSCSSGFLHLENNCKLPCKSKFFRDQSDQNCKPCHNLCTTCKGPEVTDCQSCSSKATLVVEQSYCKLNCPPNKYVDYDTCMKCDSKCQTCFGHANNNCLTCIPPLKIYQGECKCDLSSHYYLDSQDKCSECHDFCGTCSGGSSAKNCLTCATGYLEIDQEGDKCVRNCPQGYFYSSTTSCSRCEENCRSCENSDSTNSSNSNNGSICKICNLPFILHNGSCISTCPTGFTTNIQDKMCIPCNSSCGECKYKNPDICTACRLEDVILDGKCYKNCPEQFFELKDSLTGVASCEKCHKLCLKCLSESQCEICTKGHYLYEGKCVKKCPLYFTPNDLGECSKRKCDTTCKVCDELTRCTECLEYVEGTKTKIVRTHTGKCLPCIKKNGLKVVDGVCMEICGDGILLKLKGSRHNCDDGNQEQGDGCNSDCEVESKHTCLREFNLTPKNARTADQCRTIMKISLFRDKQQYKSLRDILKFESISKDKTTIMLFEDFSSHYELIYFTKDKDSKEENSENNDEGDEGSKKLFYSYTTKVNRLVVMDIDMVDLQDTMNGLVRIQKVEGSDYRLIDDKGYQVEIRDAQAPFKFSRAAFESNKANKEKIGFIRMVINHPATQVFLKLMIFSPVFFDLFAKNIKNLIYLRLIDINIPSNLDLFYEIITEGVNINFGSTPYPENDYDKPKEKHFIDRILGIDPQDYVPPQQFKKMQFSTLALKSSLPLIIYPLTLYIFSLIITVIRRKFLKKLYNKTTKKIIMVPKSKISKNYRIFFYFIDWLHELTVWSSFIKCNLFMIQQFLIGIFLNLFYKNPDNGISKISFLACFPLLLIFALNILGYYMMTQDLHLNHNNREVSNLKFLNFYKIDNIFQRNYFVIEMMIYPLTLTIIVVSLTEYGRIATGLLLMMSIINLSIIGFVRPYKSILMYIKLIFNEILMLFIYFTNFVFTFGISEDLRNIGGYIVIALVMIQCFLGLVVRLMGYQGI